MLNVSPAPGLLLLLRVETYTAICGSSESLSSLRLLRLLDLAEIMMLVPLIFWPPLRAVSDLPDLLFSMVCEPEALIRYSLSYNDKSLPSVFLTAFKFRRREPATIEPL